MAEPTQIELSQLKDEVEEFKQNPIWQHILVYMQTMYADAAEEALNADEGGNTSLIAKVKFAGGIAHAIRMIAKFDENIPVIKRAKESE